MIIAVLIAGFMYQPRELIRIKIKTMVVLVNNHFRLDEIKPWLYILIYENNTLRKT